MVIVAFALVGLAAAAFEPDRDIALSFKQGALVVVIPPRVHLKKSFMEVALAPGQKGRLAFGTLPDAPDRDELGDAVWHGTVRFPLVAQGLAGQVKVVVTYQPCTEGEGGSCFSPTDQILTVAAEALTGPAVANKAAAGGKAPEAGKPEPPRPQVGATAPTVVRAEAPRGDGKGLLVLLGIAFLAGLAASLTPCVYPMIPITMAVIGAKGGGRAKGFSLSLALVLGMAVTYTALGVVAARTGAAFGAFAQRPAFLIPVSLLFAAFALSLFGAFEISLPSGLQNRLQGHGPRQGYLGAFVMGLVLGPLAAPCVGPVVGSVLVGIAQKGDVALGGLQLFVFSLGMGTLFLVAGTFSASLPRSGDWLTRLKHGMGLVVLAFAAWNVRLVVPEAVNSLLWTVVCLTGAAVLGALEPAQGLAGQLRRTFGVLLLGLGLLLGIRALEQGLGLELLPAHGSATAAREEGAGWLGQDLEGALAKAKVEHKAVLADIYADWCAQCKELDEKTWPDPAVKAWLQANAIAVRIDTDKRRPDLAPRLQVRSYPSVIVLDAEGRERGRLLGYHKPEEMLAFLANAAGRS